MEYLYYNPNAGYHEDGTPVAIYRVEKNLNDPHPETLFCDVEQKEVPVKRYLGDCTALPVIPITTLKYDGKFKKFMNDKREATFKRKDTGMSIPELARAADISYMETKINSEGKEYQEKKYITDSIVENSSWEKMPKEKRQLANKFGIYPTKDYTK